MGIAEQRLGTCQHFGGGDRYFPDTGVTFVLDISQYQSVYDRRLSEHGLCDEGRLLSTEHTISHFTATLSNYRGGKQSAYSWLLAKVGSEIASDICCEIEDLIATYLDRTLSNWREYDVSRIELSYAYTCSLYLKILPRSIPIVNLGISNQFTNTDTTSALWLQWYALDAAALYEFLSEDTLGLLSNANINLLDVFGAAMKICSLHPYSDVNNHMVMSNYVGNDIGDRIMSLVNMRYGLAESWDEGKEHIATMAFENMECIYADAVTRISLAYYGALKAISQNNTKITMSLENKVHSRNIDYKFDSWQFVGAGSLYLRVQALYLPY